jgi:hypothetical protein
MITESRKRATKKYFDKRINEGWKYFCAFIPHEIKGKLTIYKHKLMKEYYETKIKNL